MPLPDIASLLGGVDKMTEDLRRFNQELSYTSERIKDVRDLVQRSAQAGGMGTQEIDKLTASLDKLGANRALKELARDFADAGVGVRELATINDGMKRLTAHQEQLRGLTEQYDRFKTVMAGSAVGIGIGVAGLDAVEQASKQYTDLITIQNTLGANDSQMEVIKGAINREGNPGEAAGIVKSLADYRYDENEIERLLPYMSEFANVQKNGKNAANPAGAIKDVLGLAHGFGNHTDAEVADFVEKYNKASFTSPEDNAKFTDSVRKIMSAGTKYGLSEDDVLTAASISGQMSSLGVTGGGNAADMFVGAIATVSDTIKGWDPEKPLSDQTKALQGLKLVDENGSSDLFDSKGKIKDLEEFLKRINASTKNLNSDQRESLLSTAFGAKGSGFANLMASEQGIKMVEDTMGRQKTMGSVSQMNENYDSAPQGEISKFKDSVEKFKNTVLMDAAKKLTTVLDVLTHLFEGMSQVPLLTKVGGTISYLVIGAGLLLAPLLGMINLFRMLSTVVKMFHLQNKFDAQPKPTQPSVRGMVEAKKALETAKKEVGIGGCCCCDDANGKGPKNKKSQKEDAGKRKIRVAGKLPSQPKPSVDQRSTSTKIVDGVKNFFTKSGFLDTAKKVISSPITKTALRVGRMASLPGLALTAGELLWSNRESIVGGAKKLWSSFTNAQGAIPPTGMLFPPIAGKDAEKTKAELEKSMKVMGEHTVVGLYAGMNGKGGWLQERVTAFMSQNVNLPVRSALQIASPSRVMIENGKWISEGLAAGITRNALLVKKASLGMSSQVQGPDRNALASSLQARNPGMAAGGDVHIHVHPHPQQRSEDIANEVMRKLGTAQRHLMMNTGFRVNNNGF